MAAKNAAPSAKRVMAGRIATFITFLAGIFTLASLVTYDPGDPPLGDNSPVRNLGGTWGSLLAYHLFAVLGVGSYLAVALGMTLAAAHVALGLVPRRLWVSIVSVAAAVFLSLSLVSFDAANNMHRAYVYGQPINNWCGLMGDTFSYYLLDYIGLGVWVLMFAVLAGVGAYVFRRDVKDPILRSIGLVLLACFVSGLVATMHEQSTLFQPEPFEQLPVGQGGVLGKFMADTFLLGIGNVGAYLLLIVIAGVGLILATDGLALTWPVAIAHWIQSRRANKQAKGKSANERLLRTLATSRDAEAADDSKADTKSKTEKKALAVAAAVNADTKPAQDDAKAESADAKETKEAALADGETEPAGDAETPKPKTAPKIRIGAVRKTDASAEDQRPVAGGETQMKLADNATGPGDELAAYKFPSLDLLEPPEPFDIKDEEVHIRQNAVNLEATLQQFGVQAEVVGIDTGPVITQYEVSLGAGIKVGKVISLSDDLAIGLKAPSVRIVAPLPGRGTIGIEVPNRKTKMVRIREAIEDGLPQAKRFNLPIFLGKDSAGNSMVRDLTAMPHLLIGGTTGSGKSVCLNTVITSILFTRSPRDVKFILVDPKMVEMAMFARIPHLMCPVVSDMSKVYSILEWLIGKMQERYAMLAEAGVKNIVGYNALTREQIIEKFKPTSPEDEMRLTYHMPYIVLIVDELADLMMSAPKEVEAAITRLAQKSRAVGIHLVLATQRPSVDVVTGLIKSNHPCRIAFQVASRVDSRTILDSMGAEKLLGRGDMLLMQPGASKLIRGQNAYITEDEINKVVGSISDESTRHFNRELVQLKPKDPKPARGGRGAADAGDLDGSSGGSTDDDFAARDDLYLDAVRIVLQHQRGSVSLLQRKLNIGYGRASRLIDFMAEAGLVGEYQGSQAREATISLDEWEARRGDGVGAIASVVGEDDNDDAIFDGEDEEDTR
jgi:S-DNA-T family DNA segregation ATPase FtsK/SpoIIIE